MLNSLTCAGLVASLLVQSVTARSISSPVRRQLLNGQFINQTQYGNDSTSVELSVSLNGGGRNETAPLLYGWMFEDISVRADCHVLTNGLNKV